MNILFICSSNICRSPYCEFHLKRFMKNEPKLNEIIGEVNSAAVFNVSKKLFTKAKECMLSEGFSEEDLNAHKPRFKWFYKDLFKKADIIVGMTKSHKYLTPKKYRHKFTTLTEAVYGHYIPIPDPFIRASQEKYNEDMKVLYKYLEEFKNKLLAGEIKKDCQN